MAKRFGRQQKRRMRAENDEFRQALNIKTEQLRCAKRLLDSYRDTVDTVAHVLGPDWCGLPPRSTCMEPAPGREAIVKLAYQSPVSLMSLGAVADEERACMTVSEVLLRQINSSAVYDLRRAVHVTLTWGGQAYAYALSDEAAANMPREVLQRHIMRELSDYTAGQIKQAQERRQSYA